MRAALLFGAKMVLLDRWEAEAGTELMSREGVTFTITTPAFLFDVVRSKRIEELSGLPKMKVWVIAGQILTAELYKGALAKLPQVRFARQFGMTEIGSVIINNMVGPPEKALATGLVQPGADMLVLDERLMPVGQGQTGELVLQAPSLFLGYFDKVDVTDASYTPDGYFRTGDEVRVDDDGWVWITGRIKDLIKRGGESIPPAEIEEILARHPDLSDSTVVGAPDPRLGEKVCVVAVPKPGKTISLEQLVEFVADTGLSKQKLPEQLIVVDELPRTSIGKVHKAVLKRLTEPPPPKEGPPRE
jgi:cyclohexanecarboxylate-CoA ligase